MDLRDKFKIAVLQSHGSQYENLFSSVMRYRHAGFQPVASHGNIGDRGNDGFIQSSGTYFQVYAPKDLPINTDVAKKKVREDFKKLKEYWSSIAPIKSFYFVLNDKFDGCSPHIHQTMSEIKESEMLLDAGVYLSAELERDLFGLPLDLICSVLGVSPIDTAHIAEDQKKVRDFLDIFHLAFSELFTSGREAGYYFPRNVFFKYNEMINDHWKFERLFSFNLSISKHQIAIRESLRAMLRIVSNNVNYTELNVSLKYTPPYQCKNRDALIENRKNKMGKLVNQMALASMDARRYATGQL